MAINGFLRIEFYICKSVIFNDFIFEYDIPRLGKRIDAVLLLRGIVFCLEFKVGETHILEADVDQVLDYALDLKNFHKFSQDKIIVPILIATNYRASSTDVQMSIYDDMVVEKKKSTLILLKSEYFYGLVLIF